MIDEFHKFTELSVIDVGFDFGIVIFALVNGNVLGRVEI